MAEAIPTKARIEELGSHRDSRGVTFVVPEEVLAHMGRVANVHLSWSEPGAIRGNHYHVRRREAMVVLPGPRWSLYWDEGKGSETQHRAFDGSRAVLVALEAGAAHAVRNDGQKLLWIVACSSEPFDPSETVMRKLV